MTISTNSYLTRPQQKENVEFIFTFLSSKGWTKESIMGLVGNAERESTNNFGLWQSMLVMNLSGGLGLLQWTPASKLINWADNNGKDYLNPQTQLDRIIWELENNQQWIATSQYPMSFAEFTKSTKSPDYLASVFLKNYERAGVEEEQQRRDNAMYWYKEITGSGGGCVSGTLDKMIDWFKQREGKVYYSQPNRLGPEAYDCSSAVYYSLIYGGFLPEGSMGWTGSLYDVDLPRIGKSISREECQRGDIFVTNPYANAGHTGVFTSKDTIIHCNAYDNNIRETQFEGRNGDTPKFYFRLNNGTGGNCGSGEGGSDNPETDDKNKRKMNELIFWQLENLKRLI